MSKSKFDFLIFIQIIAFEHFLSVILLLITKCLIPLIPLIDKADQMISYYDCLRKTTRWYKKVALHIIDVYIFNSYTLHKKLSGKQKANLLEFRESIVKCLIKDKLNFDVPTTSQQTGFHYLEQLLSTEKKKWPTKPCRVCSKEKRRETRYFCPVCDVKPALCVNDCFKKYHS